LNEEGKTIILVTHAPEIANCAEKIYFIRDGRITNITNGDLSRSIFRLR